MDWLKRASPKDPRLMFDTAEVWPNMNAREEQILGQALDLLVDRPQDEAIRGVGKLEAVHAGRRSYPW